MRLSGLSLLVLGMLAASGCYKPEYASNPDANMGFRCHPSDNPPCPPGLVCCVNGACGDAIEEPSAVGWCLPPQPPVDMTLSGIQYWPFPAAKPAYYAGADYMPFQLTGFDDQMQWRCIRDDTNPMPPDKIRHMGEPNDLPAQAVVLQNPLSVDPGPGLPFSNYQICPDRTAPDQPDIDIYKFKLNSPTKLIAEIRYLVANGDLDMALFRLDPNPDTNIPEPTLLDNDLKAVDNACIEHDKLAAGTYYLAVRGAAVIIPDMPSKWAMNNYSLRVFTVVSSGYSCNPSKDGGP